MNLLPALKKMFDRPVEPVSVITLKGDASSRRYHRIVLPSGLGLRSLVVMELPDGEWISPGRLPSELPFVNVRRALAAKGLRVPEIYLDAASSGLLLLEDLGDQTLGATVQGASDREIRAWYSATVDLLVEVHRCMWPIATDCVAATRKFDYELLRWELDHYRQWGVEALRDEVLDPAIRQSLDWAFDALAKEIDELPRGFVHRDYQSRNLMVVEGEPSPRSLAIIDFQDAFVGPRTYDLVALLNDSYVTLEAPLKQELIHRYATGVNLDPGAVTEEFHLITVQRKLKDGGRFVFIDREKGDPSFLPFIDSSFLCVSNSLAQLPGHDALKQALKAVDPKWF
jgi:hypothetical protein